MQVVPGTVVGAYEVVAPLGKGGMGEVYLATDHKLRRRVALKILPSEFSSDTQRKQRFLQEAHAASILVHPHICVIHDVGEAGGLLYISMEYIEGETLADRLGRETIDPVSIANIGAQVADAIDEAHAKGITHRDLKPANIMITSRGHAKVLDFGLAKLRSSDELGNPAEDTTDVKSMVGTLSGTLPYMSPEQALGHPVDHRSDIFSLGVILYEMATRRLPFSGSTPAERIANIVYAEAPSLSQRNPSTPAELERVIRKCLAKDPDDRYQSAHELELDLRNLEHGRHREGRHPRRWRRTAAAIASAGIIIVAAVVIRSKLTGHSDVDSLAVLPFVNATHDPQIEYLSDGMSDTLIDNLSQLPKLRVMARSTTYRYKGQSLDVKRIGKDLGVNAILAGSVVEHGNALEIQAELVRTADGSRIWGSRYDGQASDAASFGQQITGDVIRAIRGRLEAGQQQAKISRRTTDDPEAYQLYLKGQYARNRATQQSLLEATQLFQRVIDRDPNFAPAYVGLADTYLSAQGYLDQITAETLPKARAAATKALELDNTMPEAFASLAWIQFNSWEWDEAEKNFRKSIELNPNYAQVHLRYAAYLTTLSRIPEALQQARLAQTLEPQSTSINSEAAGIKLVAGHWDEGMGDLRRVADIDPNMPLAHQWLSFGYLRKKQYDRAIEEAKKEIETSGHTTLSVANAAFIYHAAGRKAEATAAAEEVIRAAAFADELNMACAYISIDDFDTAFRWLDRGMLDRSGSMNYITWPPWFDNIHEDPRYRAILRRLGLRKYNGGEPVGQ